MEEIDILVRKSNNEVIEELLKDMSKLMSYFADKYSQTIKNCERDDLYQELCLKVVDIVNNTKYDPERVKPTSFFYPIFRNHLNDLHRKQKTYLKLWDSDIVCDIFDGFDIEKDQNFLKFVLLNEDNTNVKKIRISTSKVSNRRKQH